MLKPCVACVCDGREKLNFQVCSSYDVIFSGQVEGFATCEEGVSAVTFSVSELYKGRVNVNCEVEFVCGSEDCSIGFQEGQEWLVFVDKNNAQVCVFDLCSHSRQLLPSEHAVYDNELRGSSFFEDKNFLNNNFEANKGFNDQLQSRRYKKVDPVLIPVFMGVSVLFMLLGVFVFKRLSKKRKQ